MYSSSGWTAFVDESGSNRALDPGTYILAAAIVDHDDLAGCTETMTKLRLRGAKKLHWRDDSDARHAGVISAVASLPLEHLVVVRSQGEGDRNERRRRLTLRRLCVELDRLGVGQMVVESRGAADDRRDRAALDGFRAQKQLTGALRMDHVPGPAEPMLWVPDAVCGAVTAARVGDPQHLAVIRSKLTLVEILP